MTSTQVLEKPATMDDYYREKQARRKKELFKYYSEDIPTLKREIAFREKCLQKDLLETRDSLYLHGGVGTGKTILAIQIGKSIIDRQLKEIEDRENKQGHEDYSGHVYVPRFISSIKFIIKLQCAFTTNESVELLLRSVSESKYVIIDDIGSEKMTDFVRQSLLYIIDHRESNELQTIITSNLSLQEIDDNLGSRIGSRIAGMCEVIELKGKDRRLAQ